MYTYGLDRRLPPAPRRGEATDRVWAGVILAELRQAAIGYTEAALESTSPDVRRVFERLAYDTSRKHEQLTAILQQNRLLEPAFAAPAAEVQRAAAQAAETARAARAFAASRAVSAASTAPSAPQPGYVAPRTQGFSTYMGLQQPPYQPPQQPASRPPEFALPHNMPFGGLPGGAYVPPQPQPHFGGGRDAAGPSGPSAGAAHEAPAPTNRIEPEPAVTSAVREEASLGTAPEAPAAEAAAPEAVAAPTATPAPKRSGGRRAKASADAAAAEPEQLTT